MARGGIVLALVAGLSGCSVFIPDLSPPPPPPWAPLERADVHEGVDAAATVVGRLQRVVARHEDTFVDIARRFNVGYDELVAANPGVDPWLPGEGTVVLLPTAHVIPDAPRRGIVINVATMRLWWFAEPDEEGRQTVITHPIGIGRVGWATPVGETRVIDKAVDPTWYPPASVRREHAADGDPLPAVVPPGPDNPLGRHVVRLDMPGYLIHGTNKPSGVGMRVSHGCVRLYPEDIEALYERIPRGLPVALVDQPWLVGEQQGELVLEAHAALEDGVTDWTRGLGILEDRAGDAPVDWERAGVTAARALGVPLPVGVAAPGDEAWLARAPVVAMRSQGLWAETDEAPGPPAPETGP